MYEKKMEWKGGEVPVSEPACGFDGAKCQLQFRKLHSPYLPDVAYVVLFTPLMWLSCNSISKP